MSRRWAILLACFSLSPSLQAAQTVSTDTLRLTFGESGALETALACFPGCSDDRVRLQQFADGDLLGFEGFTSGQWTLDSSRGEEGYRLDYVHSSGATVSWTIPAHGYRIELDLDLSLIHISEPTRLQV